MEKFNKHEYKNYHALFNGCADKLNEIIDWINDVDDILTKPIRIDVQTMLELYKRYKKMEKEKGKNKW